MIRKKTIKRTAWSVCLAGVLPLSAHSAADLLISEYIEGSSNNKALEIYNPTGADIDLAAYELQFFFNGSSSAGLTLNLQGVLADGDVYVVANSNAVSEILAQADLTSGAGFYNGDDAIVLLNGGVTIDSIGQIGVDPGSEWGSGDTSTQNNTLRRLASVTAGDADPYDSFDPALEWEGFPSDTFDDLGQYGEGSGGPGGGDPDPDAGVCGDPATLISEIQGDGTSSPLAGSFHVVEAVVTGLRSDGFFVQEEAADEDGNPLTSEGLYIYGDATVAVGNRVRVAGEVTEYFGLTEISAAAVVDCGAGPGITPINVVLPLPESLTLEQVEGMMVSVSDLTVTDINNIWRYGEIGLSNTLKVQPTEKHAPGTAGYEALVAANEQNIILIEDDNGSRFPAQLSFYPQFSYASAIRVGDLVSATGPLNYSFGQYRINPQQNIVVLSGREAAPDVVSGNLSVASFNVLNYFNGQPTAEGGVTFDYAANRGAENEEEFALQQARIVEALVTLDADIVGLMEIENDGFDEVSAIQSLVDAVNAHLAPQDAYEFVATQDGSLVGTDAIAVGLMYRPGVVTPAGVAQKIDMPVQDLGNGDTQQMRTSLLQSFLHPDSGQELAVVVNHFKSKGSECFEDLNSPTDNDQIQGSCNALRVSAAVTLGRALQQQELPERLMILGDLNAYSAEDPLAVLTGYSPEERGYTIRTALNTNLDGGSSVPVTETFGFANVAKVFDPDGFSYWFYANGLVGSLDHILVNPVLLDDVVDATHWNINAPEAYQLQYDQALAFYPDDEGYAFTEVGPYRSSDHDPFVVTLALPDRVAPGDFNADGRINVRDLVALVFQFHRRVTDDNRQFDLTGDGRINVRDLLAFLRLWK